MGRIPSSLKRLFWEFDLADLNLKRDKNFIVERVLEKGRIEEVRVIFKTYSLAEIKEALRKSYNLSRSSGILWSKVLSIREGGIRCLKKSSRKILLEF